ncbi:chromodomain Y-like protein 2 [Pezoporus wallicus]|uniref:chromodomain Y-like protein 2 n=1 Tax=Pezoporus wallicus TaxID=35540 RepID=UPI00255060B1|nr:chromodomain Y-like protein 2 [Pezoporus wallicus]
MLVEAVKNLGKDFLQAQQQALVAQQQATQQVFAALAPLRPPDKGEQRKGSSGRRHNKCFRCGRDGHIRRDCRAGQVWCENCKSSNHNTAACYRSGNGQQSASSRRAQTTVAAPALQTPVMQQQGPPDPQGPPASYNATRGSLGLDLATAVDITLIDSKPQRVASPVYGPLIINGQAVGALLLGRSSTGLKGLMILPGVIDADYQGRIDIVMYTLFPPLHIPAGSRVAQLVPIAQVTKGMTSLSNQERNDQGFGSTGVAAMLTLSMKKRPIVTAQLCARNETVTLALLLDTGSSLANGSLNLHSTVKRKLEREKDYVFDKRLRYSVRQNESNCRFRDIVVRKEDGFTHILLSSQTSDNNALTPEIMKEVRRALCNASADDSKLLFLSAVGSVFCSGLDYSYLIGRLSNDRRKESTRIAEAIRDFVKAFIQFKKPIVVAINGPALGLGASILPLCDIVWASEKAWFQTPYATIRLTPDGCSSYTFPQILGVALANEMLFCGRKLTAQEACSRGLVSQVFWPTTFSQEVMLRVKEMASCSAVVLEESKCLMRSFLKSGLEDVNEKECQMLKQLWSSSKGLDSLFSYLQDRIYEV